MADNLCRAQVVIGGQLVKVEFKPTAGIDIQYLKGAQWGHIRSRCVMEGARCFICAGKHEMSDYFCIRCRINQKCGHVAFLCSNCKGKHRADNSMYKMGRMARQQVHIQETDTRWNEQINRLKTRITPRPWF